ncbi:MAG: hypothetical protein IJ532_00815 [Alphaproteobacteria bacterium]|nr:hypothetical protein [Alphaproteobacteria bacterium]
MAQKSIFEKFFNIFMTDKDKAFGKNISINEALNIQNDYAANQCDNDKLPGFPYVEIAKQLAYPKQEIFDAALYYMQRIAVNEPKIKNRIVDLLESISNDTKIEDDRKLLISQAIKNIKSIK